jgi:DNA-binding FadR family transcriptional regulator
MDQSFKIVEDVMGKEKEVLASLVGMIAGSAWQIGDRLPPERELAEAFDASRGTMRNVLRVLQAKGVLEVRRGSGCYLLSRRGLDQCVIRGEPVCAPDDEEDANDGPERLEACYVVFPSLAALCAERIGPDGLAELEECMVALSRAIFTRNVEAIREETSAYLRTLAEGAGNPSLVAAVDSLCPGSPSLFNIFFSLEDYEREEVFGDSAKLLHALKRRDPEEARRRMQERIFRLCRLMEKYEGLVCSEFLRREMQDKGESA